MDFHSVGCLPQCPIGALAEGTIFCQLTCVGVKCIAVVGCVLAKVGGMWGMVVW